MKTDGVSTAFQIILEQIDTVVLEVNQQGAVYFHSNDYKKAEFSLDAGKTIKAFRERIEALNNEWVAFIEEPTRKKVLVQPSDFAKPISSRQRSSKKCLIVKFMDGVVLYERNATETFVLALRKLGVQRVAALGLKVNNFDQRQSRWSQLKMWKSA